MQVKTLLFIIFLIFCTTTSVLCQTGKFGLNESGKYVFYEEVSQKGIKENALLKKAQYFFESDKSGKFSKLQKAEDKNAVMALGFFQVYKNLSFITHPEAKINYHISIEAKDDKYRIILSNFIYTKLERDRFGNYSSVGQPSIPIEKTSSQKTPKAEQEIQSKTATQCLALVEKIKNFMNAKEVSIMQPGSKDTIKIHKW